MSGYNTFVTGNNDDNNNNHAANTTTTAAAATTSSSSPLIPNELRHRRRSASHTTSSLGSDSDRSQSNNHSSPAPHLYSTPFASRALVSAFGLPTLVEYEPPSAGIAEEEPPPSSGALPSLRDSSASDAFEPVALPSSRRSHVRSRSLSAEQHPHPHPQQPNSQPGNLLSRLTRSAYSAVQRSRSHDEHSDDGGPPLHHLYTYRVRTFDKTDDHHILMCQNPDYCCYYC